MKRKITITFEVDPNDFVDTVDTPDGTIDLALAIMQHDTDPPDDGMVVIECDGEKREVEGYEAF